MSFVRTILGDIDSGGLGVCYAHEHVIIDASFTTLQYPDYLLDSVENAVADLTAFRRAGGRAMIDSMPGGGAGRNVLKLAEVSRRAGVHIVAPTGLHLSKYYPPGHWSTRVDEDQLAELFVQEIDRGIDASDLIVPAVRPTPHRAGVIKVASSFERLSDQELRTFRAAARAHRATGCPVITHCEQGSAAMQQIEVLAAGGVDLSHVVLSHTDRRPDFDYQREILQTGVRVEYDSGFRWKPEQGNPTLDLVVGLIDRFPNQILLGMDAARRTYWTSYGGSPGIAWLLEQFVPRLKEAGVTEEQVHRIFVDNPARAYSFATGEAPVSPPQREPHE